MRRPVALAIAAILALAIVTPVSAGGNQSFHYAAKGVGADALWTTYPVDGTPVAGTIYRDTFTSASTSITRSDGVVFSGSGMFIESFTYKFDRKGNFVPLGDTFVFIDGATLTVDQKLTGATVAGSGTADVCSIDTSGMLACTSGTISFAGTWTGQGPLNRQHGTTTWGIAGVVQSTWHGTGTFRAATAVGTLTVNGATIAIGANLDADMYSMRSGENDLFICHGTC